MAVIHHYQISLMDYNYSKVKLNRFVSSNALEWDFVKIKFVIVHQGIILKTVVVLRQNIKPI